MQRRVLPNGLLDRVELAMASLGGVPSSRHLRARLCCCKLTSPRIDRESFPDQVTKVRSEVGVGHDVYTGTRMPRCCDVGEHARGDWGGRFGVYDLRSSNMGDRWWADEANQ